ncbi:acyltransferase family protein [Halobacillus amylolyticus]|uniref:Acyltransferase family protein n=1 Tax=Halobacillus amylolyticus TaxID=2932259 RepID=A0ABY4H9P0_9BACI|nr:acyltransferase family protein [Halobacillus amylolyticus]UOR11158.1 acyltransferase family protein [Halobacillus amylolyticus]
MKREALFDNAKLLLIFLVVFGHLIQPFTDGSHIMYTIYMWIYTFHMPAFILLSGFFAKGLGDKDYIVNLAKKLILPYMIFQLTYTGYFFFIGKDGWLSGPFYPHWSLWFLFSLFCWHIMLYWFKKVPAPLGMFVAVGLGIVVGYFNDIGHMFSLSRTFVFFPFFLAGYWLTKENVKKWRTPQVREATLLFATVVVGLIAIFPEFDSGWLLGSKSYSILGNPEFGGLLRFGVYVIGGIMTVCILAWIPNKSYRFSVLGGRTLYVYLLHGFFIQFFREAGWFKVDNIFDFAGLAIVSASIVFLLSSTSIRTLTQPVIEGRVQLMKKWWYKLAKKDYTTN